MAGINGGDKLEARLAEIARRLKHGAVVKIGFLEGATYPDGTSVALVAALNEFGVLSRGQPPRPAFRNMIAEKKNDWPASIEKLLEANNYDAERVLMLMGEGIAGQLRQSIIDIMEPPLVPSTIKRKGFDKPWIETGNLLQSVDYEVDR